MDHNLITENFMIKLETQVFEGDISYPENTSLKISVKSNGFSAMTTMDIDIKELAQFAIDLKALYNSLKGSAKLQEPYGSHNYFEFLSKGDGYIIVKGSLRNSSRNGCIQELNFTNKFDQTYLKTFQEEINISCQKYLQSE